ncbi:MAG: FHA domain-containing protein [Phycisphaerales bacterium]|nr:FHA domain-containing protein [Phycisphaerales bacterium]
MDRAITIHIAPADDEPGVIELRVQPDGSIRAGSADLEPDADPRVIQGWSVRVARGADPLTWSGPELLIFAASRSGERLRCPLPTDDGRVVVLGRSRRACDVVVPDEHVSRVHLKITAVAGGHTVEDCQSRWGTQVNGRRLDARHVLVHADEIRIGASTIRYVTRWDEAAFRPVGPGLPATGEQTLGAETLASAPEFGFEHVERPRPRTPDHGSVQRHAVPPLWIGIGIGITMALVAMVIYSLVLWLWPEG